MRLGGRTGVAPTLLGRRPPATRAQEEGGRVVDEALDQVLLLRRSAQEALVGPRVDAAYLALLDRQLVFLLFATMHAA